MVSVVDQSSPSDLIGRIIGQGIAQNAPRGFEQAQNRQMLQSSLDEVSKLSKSGNSNPIDLSLAVMKAGAGIPGSERYLGQILPKILELAQARNSQNVQYPGQSSQTGLGQSRDRSPIEQPQRVQQLPQFGEMNNEPGQFFPGGQLGNESPGNLTQSETQGVIKPLLSPQQQLDQAPALAKQLTDNGITTSVPQAYQMIKANNEENALHNQRIQSNTEAVKLSQADYGAKAANILNKYIPNATPQETAIIKKEAEEAAKTFKSEADIEQFMAKSSEKLANEIIAVEKSLSAPRFQNEFYRKTLGNASDLKQATEDLRVKLKPLLDRGLYDKARTLAADLGYYPEERENAILPMNAETLSMVKTLPQANKERDIKPLHKRAGILPFEEHYSPRQLQDLSKTMVDIFQKDPNVSQVLLRKAFEDQGYDWRTYKDVLNENVKNGRIKLNPDQQNQNHYLETPPLNHLQKILHGLNIIGR